MHLTAYTLTVPCKPYIKKYFSAIYGDPIALNHSTDFGDTILTKMSTTPISRVSQKVLRLPDRQNDYTGQLKFSLPIDTLYRLKTELTDQQEYNINRYLENVFETDLYMSVACAGFFGIERKVIIERWAERYGIRIDEDITYEALKKKEYRYRNSSTAKNLFLNQLSSPFAVFKRA